MKVRLRIAAAFVLLAGAAPVLGCNTFQGARLYQSGTAALDRGDAPRAIADLERAAALAPQASEVQNHLGLAYLKAGRRVDAVQSFERAVALDCENAAAAHNLAITRAVQASSRAPDAEAP